MAKVIKRFKERYHDMKRYDVGDEYPETDKKRVAHLTKLGFLEQELDPTTLDPNAPPIARSTKKRSKKGTDKNDSNA